MRFINLFCLCLVNFMWAAQYPAYKVASERRDVTNLNFWTFVFAMGFLVPFLAREHMRPRHTVRLDRKSAGELLLLGLAGNLPPSVFSKKLLAPFSELQVLVSDSSRGESV